MISFMVVLPLFVAVLIALVRSDFLGRLLFLGASLVELVLGVWIFWNFDPNGGVQFAEIFALFARYSINYAVGVDGISLLILLIIVCSFPPLFWLVDFKKKEYWANLLIMQSAFLLVASATDLILFYAGWEMMLMPIFFFVGIYGFKSDRYKAMMDMLYYAIFGSMIMLGAIIYLGVAHFREFGFYSFALSDLTALNLPFGVEAICFFAFMIAFAIKVPLFPFHLWLGDAYTKSPTTATFMLSVIASKIAILAILRFVLPLFPLSFVEFSQFFIYLGIFSMLYFGVAAVRTSDFKTLLAYASASHLGLIIAGAFSLQIEGLVGAIYQATAHALASGIMFLLVAHISKELLTRDINKLGGIAKIAPVFSTYFAIALISSVGLPGTIGFIGELLIIYGLFETNIFYGIVATSSIVIGAIYMFILYRKAILRGVNDLTAKFHELNRSEIFAILIPIIMIFVLGLYSRPFISKIEPTIESHFENFIKPNLGAK